MTDHDELIRQVRDRAERLPIETPSPRSAMDKGRQRRRFSVALSAMAALIIATGVAVPLRALMRLGEDAPATPIGPSPSGAASFPEPTGTIAYFEGHQSFGSIALLDTASGSIEQLSNQRFSSITLAWSPDRSSIALSRSILEGNGELVLVSATTGQIIETMPIDPGLSPQDVDWAPDGKSLAFTDTYARLHVIGADGSGLRKVPTGGLRALNIAWSPDGDEIAFVGDKGDLAVVDLRTGQTDIVFVDPHGQSVWFGPAWSPDGEFLAFSVSTDDGSTINIIQRDGTEFRQLTDGALDGVNPTWSPDGNWIAFEVGGDQKDLFAVAFDGSRIADLTNTPKDEYAPDWG